MQTIVANPFFNPFEADRAALQNVIFFISLGFKVQVILYCDLTIYYTVYGMERFIGLE